MGLLNIFKKKKSNQLALLDTQLQTKDQQISHLQFSIVNLQKDIDILRNELKSQTDLLNQKQDYIQELLNLNVSKNVLNNFTTFKETATTKKKLTDKEQEIYDLIKKGNSREEVSKFLNKPKSQIRVYIHKIKNKGFEIE